MAMIRANRPASGSASAPGGLPLAFSRAKASSSSSQVQHIGRPTFHDLPDLDALLKAGQLGRHIKGEFTLAAYFERPTVAAFLFWAPLHRPRCHALRRDSQEVNVLQDDRLHCAEL